MLSRLLLLLGSFLFVIFSCRGQAYEPGLLVRANGDTLRGEIENSFWVEPPAFIRFRPAPGSPSELFKPRQLQAVSFTKGRYFRYVALPLDQAAETRLDRLPRVLTTDIRVDSLLAEVLLEGPLSLLRVALPNTTHYVLYQPDQPALDLCARQYLRPGDNGSWGLAEGNNYRGQLGHYFRECPAALRAAENVAFTAKGLATVVQAYNEKCSGAPQQLSRDFLLQSSPRRRVAFTGGVLGGVRYNSLTSDSPFLLQQQVDGRPHPFVGLYTDLLQPNRRLAIYGELSLSSFRSRGAGYFKAGTAITSYGTYDYKALLGTARLGLRLFFPLPHEQQWLLGFGYELNKSFRPAVTQLSGQPAADDEAHTPFPTPVFVPNVGVGWRRQRLTLGLDGQMYRKVSDVPTFFGSDFALRLGLAYRLGRHPDAAPTPPAAARP
ncbi:hypothetical protein [uncultured Hymenobacter sp.]|uniref:hypothetical protein n=1 Tax=uncultured Hymenobacter sp. TaxID=170016 RepID=UPI0035CABE23